MQNPKKIVQLFALAATVASFAIVTSCHKTKKTSEDTSYSTDYASAEKMVNDVQTISDQASKANGSTALRETGSGCATITRSFNGVDSVLTINFGTSDCLCHDGSYRRGEIIVTFTGNYADSGSVHTMTFSNFFHNDNQITGTKTVTNMGHNSLGQVYFNVVDNCTIIKANGESHSVSWNRVRTWITVGSPNVYSITGSGTLVRPNGRTVTVNITSPLIVSSDCRWIEAGTVVHTMPNGLSRTVNYGSTAVCDDVAEITLPNGTTMNVTLP